MAGKVSNIRLSGKIGVKFGEKFNFFPAPSGMEIGAKLRVFENFSKIFRKIRDFQKFLKIFREFSRKQGKSREAKAFGHPGGREKGLFLEQKWVKKRQNWGRGLARDFDVKINY